MSKHMILCAILLLAWTTFIEGASFSCSQILASNPDAASGVYTITLPASGAPIQVYCEMGLNGGGYTFINPRYLNLLSSWELDIMFSDRTSFLLRQRKCDNTQPYSVLTQLQEYASIPLYLGLNTNTGYNSPVNAANLGTPFLYFGFLPQSSATNTNVQGLGVNGQSITFANCDSNPNSYIALFANFKELPPSNYLYGTPFPMCDALFASAVPNPSTRVMPGEYFMFTETHWGGCGCYTQTDARLSDKCILGTAIGFR